MAFRIHFLIWISKKKKMYLCHRIRMEWYYYKDCRKKKKYHAIPYCAVTFESFISKKDINLILLTQINFYKCEICLR